MESNHLGQKYLTMQRGKHRYVDDTPENHKYCAYPFSPYGIGDDLGSTPMYVTDIWAVEDTSSHDNENKLTPLDSLF